MKQTQKTIIAALGVLAFSVLPAQAADWSDTSIGYRTGNSFAEPYEGNSIHKDIFDLNHISGYKYGSNFFNVDLLMSDANDPASPGSSNGAQEAYVVYRNYLDYGKVTGTSVQSGLMRGFGLTTGFDWNAKTDAGYNSKKRMLVAGPTIELDVPGFLDVSLLELWESNAPYNDFSQVSTPRYNYAPHPMVGLAWGVPIKASGFSFEGYADIIAPKGQDEFGNQTATETNIDMEVMYDISSVLAAKPKSFKVGFEYQYWQNKFGNDASGPAGQGAFARTPMLRAEVHF